MLGLVRITCSRSACMGRLRTKIRWCIIGGLKKRKDDKNKQKEGANYGPEQF